VELCRGPILICSELLGGEEDSCMEFGKMDWENCYCVGRSKKAVGDAQLGAKDLSNNDVEF